MPDDPSKTSSEYDTMKPEWEVIEDIMAGARAIRKRSTHYLPQYEKEANEEYRRRKDSAPWRPEFTDILRSLASKPFGKEVAFKGQAPDAIIGTLDPSTKERAGGIADDIDGRGNGLTVFAREAFSQGIAKGMHAILVDFPTMQPDVTRADEKAAGARPYWVQIPAQNIIALYTEIQGGCEVVTHVRIRETTIERDGFGEVRVEQVRVLEPGRWQVWRQNAKAEWLIEDSGPLNRGGETSVPMVLFFTGDRIGTLAVRPPLGDLAQMQIELYQALSRQDEVLTFAGSPMLAAIGLAAPGQNEPSIQVGPKTVLFAPAAGAGVKTGWEFVQPAATNIAEIRKHVTSIQEDMRRIGMQPLTEMLGNPTATGQSINAAKAHSAVKAWALMLNDALEQAFKFTAEWMGLSDTIETEVSTDFSVQPYAQFPLQSLAAARATKDLSQKTYWSSLKRFDVLSQDFDPDTEIKLLEDERLATIDAGEANAEPAAQEAVNIRL